VRHSTGLPAEYAAVRIMSAALLRMLVNNLPGIQIGHQTQSTAVVAYADDVSVFVTSRSYTAS
jgi:hypothetical protein